MEAMRTYSKNTTPNECNRIGAYLECIIVLWIHEARLLGKARVMLRQWILGVIITITIIIIIMIIIIKHDKTGHTEENNAKQNRNKT